MFRLCAFLASVFLLFAFLFQLFVLIGGASNKDFLRSMYFNRFYNHAEDKIYDANLWTYCSGTANHINYCSGTKGAFNWATTPEVSQYIPDAYTRGKWANLYRTLLATVFIGTGMSLIGWLATLPFCCVPVRSKLGTGIGLSTYTFVNLLFTLASWIIAMTLIVSINKTLIGSPWTGAAGNSLWVTICAIGSLVIAYLCLSGMCCAGRGGSGGARVGAEGFGIKQNRRNSRGRRGLFGKRKTNGDDYYDSNRHLPTTMQQRPQSFQQQQQPQPPSGSILNNPAGPFGNTSNVNMTEAGPSTGQQPNVAHP